MTPLTLAAKLARKELFFHILNLEREIYWQIGSVTCAAYPLHQFDTIDPLTGGIQKESALNLIVFGESTAHLDLLEGPVMDLLHAKWNTFVKFRFYRQFFTFLIYFLISINAFITRPIHKLAPSLLKPGNTTFNSTLFNNQSNAEIANATLLAQQGANLSALLAMFPDPVIYDISNDTNSVLNSTLFVDWSASSGTDTDTMDVSASSSLILNASMFTNGTNETMNGTTQWLSWSKCLVQPATDMERVRLTCECLMLVGAVTFLLGALRECQFLGASMFFENLVSRI